MQDRIAKADSPRNFGKALRHEKLGLWRYRVRGVLAVLTGADWQASGYGDLPVPGGYKRRDGSPLYRPRYPALVKDRVRWVGDCVAFVVAETYHQAADAAELIEVDYETLPAA